MAEDREERPTDEGPGDTTAADTGDAGEIREPDSSTVDDWFGQNVARDQAVADEVSEEHDDPDAAEDAFEERARGQERYEAGHPRPTGRGPFPSGDGPIGDPEPRRERQIGDRESHHRGGMGALPGEDGEPEDWDDRLAPRAEPSLVRLLQGSFLGRPLHPMLNDLPIGFWTSAWFLDLFGGHRSREAADKLIGLGVVAAVPAAVTGLADRRKLDEDRQGLAALHLGANAAATSLYGLSWLLRRRGSRGIGVAVSHVAALCATVGGDLGGRLAFGDAPDGHDAAPDGAGPPTGPVAQR